MDFLPPEIRKKINNLAHDLKLRKSHGSRLQISGTIRLAVSLGCKCTFVNLQVAEHLAKFGNPWRLLL